MMLIDMYSTSHGTRENALNFRIRSTSRRLLPHPYEDGLSITTIVTTCSAQAFAAVRHLSQSCQHSHQGQENLRFVVSESINNESSIVR